MSVIRDGKEPAKNCPHRTLRRGVRREVLIWAKQLRANPAAGEAALWSRLRASRMGFRFRRQAILRGWIADFWCPAKRLVVEVDGCHIGTRPGESRIGCVTEAYQRNSESKHSAFLSRPLSTTWTRWLIKSVPLWRAAQPPISTVPAQSRILVPDQSHL